MGNGVFNVAKGRIAGWATRIAENDPADSAFVMILATGPISDIQFRDYQTLEALLLDADISEATFGGYGRRELTAPEVKVDHAANTQRVEIVNQTWIPTTSQTLSRLVICYDEDTTGGGDASIVPCTFHDFAVATSGTSVTANVQTFLTTFDFNI